MNKYELTLLLDGKTTPAKKKAVLEKIEKLVSFYGGKIDKSTDWGKKELAYRIKKNDEGVYLFLELSLDPKGAKEIQSKLSVDDTFLRYLVVKVDK